MSDTYDKFLEFRRLNPALEPYFVACAREAMAAGYERYGFPYIYNMARWEFGVKVRNTEFELNNDIAPYYARCLMMEYPDLYGFFEVRSSLADRETGWTQFKLDRDGPSLELQAPLEVDVDDVDVTQPKPVARATLGAYEAEMEMALPEYY